MFGLFKRRKRCNHEWEIIGYGNIYKFEFDGSAFYNFLNIGRLSVKKVCIKCGECVDEEKEWLIEYEKQEEKKRTKQDEIVKRKELAKKMWENCNN